MTSVRILICVGMFIAGTICCGAISAGPIDNANESVESAVENAEANNNRPTDQSGDSSLISWGGQSSGTDAAVNTDTTASGQDSQ